jgi:Domain of unknown function (DUF3560)
VTSTETDKLAEPGMITITHTHADGTLLAGSRKGDGVYELLKGLRDNWRYFPSIRAIGIGQSRDNLASQHKISRAAAALRAAGHEVTVTIDESDKRSFAEAEAERYARAESRAEYHEERAAVAESRAAGHWEAERGILDMIPMGQPILIGHHSEGRHRRDLARADSHMRRGIEEIGKRDYHQDRASSAETYRAGRESVPVTLRRIKKLETEQRDIQRRLDGYTSGRAPYVSEHAPATGAYRERLTALGADIAEQLAYWRGIVAAAAESGVKVWSAADFSKGDFVHFIGSWYEVVRVNAKSLTIPAMINDGGIVRREGARCTWTDTIPYDKVKGRKTAAEIAELDQAAS